MEQHVILPTINAFLNTLSTVLLLAGWISIRHKDREKHRKFMTAALVSSALFLFFYVLNRIIVGGLTHYQGQGISRFIYFLILGTHTPLAMIILPFSIMAVWHARHQNFRAHVAITRWLLPVWLYVSVTGVIIYVMLYVL
jgi:putative membrane protein